MTNTTALDLDRRSLPVDASGIKTWEDRTDDTTPGAMMMAMEAEIADLRAALAAKGQQEPVIWYDGSAPLDTGKVDEGVRGLAIPDGTSVRHGKNTAPLYAAPVAQQSEAGACRWPTCQPEAVQQEVADQAYRELYSGEAGAPTAAAEQIARVILRLIGECAMDWHAGDPEDGFNSDDEELRVLVDLVNKALAGRESAAPAAPVREGDREQDAKEQRMRSAFENCRAYRSKLLFKRGGSVFAENVPEDKYVDSGAQAAWEFWQEAWAAALSTAMQKGAQDNG